MIKRILLACFLFVVISAQAQDPVLKKNVTGVQIGLFELDAYNETTNFVPDHRLTAKLLNKILMPELSSL